MQLKPIFDFKTNIDQTDIKAVQDVFSDEQLMWINNLKELYPYQDATTVGNGDDSVRKSRIKWIHYDDKSWWVYDRLSELFVEVNKDFGFDLHSIVDSLQYTEYYEGGGHYDWHMDIGPYPINHRKISVTIQLSDSNEYEGGDFDIWTGGSFKTLPRIKSCGIFFPSFLLHRVTPITKGCRKSLVLWIGGGNYK